MAKKGWEAACGDCVPRSVCWAFYGVGMQTLSDRIGVITGASAGIGYAIAKQYVAAGARVVINGRRGEKLEAIAKF